MGGFNLPPGVSLRDVDPNDERPTETCDNCGREFYAHEVKLRYPGLCPRCIANEENNDMNANESLVKKVKEGDKVVFHIEDNENPTDWGYEADEPLWAEVIEHDGQVATVTGVAVDDGDPASQVVDGPFYVDIEFADGFSIAAASGYNLTPVKNAQIGVSGKPVQHDFIPSASSESVDNQAKRLLKTVLERNRKVTESDDVDWEEPGGPSDEQVRANDQAHRVRMAGGQDPEKAAVKKVVATISEWNIGQMYDLMEALANMYTDHEVLNNMDAPQIEQHLREAAKLIGEATGA